MSGLAETGAGSPRVLVVGSSGGVGHLAVQLAAAAGARVTAVSGPDAVQFARDLGAHHVLDRSRDALDAEGVREVRWWSPADLQLAQDVVFAPRRLPELLVELLSSGPPRTPLDVGV